MFGLFLSLIQKIEIIYTIFNLSSFINQLGLLREVAGNFFDAKNDLFQKVRIPPPAKTGFCSSFYYNPKKIYKGIQI
jgi:hypothetical protein